MSPNDIVGLILGVLGILSILLTALGWWIRQKIAEATRQIQPNTNGGLSLTDLHKKVDDLVHELSALRLAVLTLENDVERIEHDLEEH